MMYSTKSAAYIYRSCVLHKIWSVFDSVWKFVYHAERHVFKLTKYLFLTYILPDYGTKIGYINRQLKLEIKMNKTMIQHFNA